MTIMPRAAAIAGLLTLAWLSPAKAIVFYVVSEPDRAVYRIDSKALGKPELVGKLEGQGAVMGIVDLGDGELLLFDSTNNSMLTFSLKLQRVVSEVKLDRDLDLHVRGIAMDSKGVIYGVFPGLKLATIDRVTGQTTPVVTLQGAARVEAIAFGPNDRLFASGSAKKDGSSENFYRVDLKTGELDLIGAHGFADLDTLAFGRDTYFYGTNSRAELTNELLRVSPRGGKKDVVGDTGVRGVNAITLPREH
jgi:hypothetical protein